MSIFEEYGAFKHLSVYLWKLNHIMFVTGGSTRLISTDKLQLITAKPTYSINTS